MRHPSRTFAALLIAAPLQALAGHPYVTDDTGTQGEGNWQLELTLEEGRHANAVGAGALREVARQFSPTLTYGLSDRLDIAIGPIYLDSVSAPGNGAPGSRDHGVGDSALELKWRFYERQGFSLGVRPGFAFATGDERKGLGKGGISYNLRFMATGEVDGLTLLANLAYGHSNFPSALAGSYRSDLWQASAGFGRRLTEAFRLVGEAGKRTNPARDSAAHPGAVGSFAMLGVVYAPSARIDWDIGLRKGLNKAEHDTTVLLGGTFRW